MLELALLPFRGEVGVVYDSAFLYLSVRGAVAERWAYTPGFGRHSIGPDNLRLLDKAGSRLAEVNLKNSRFMEARPELNWEDFVATASEFVTDCLTALQPGRVSAIYGDVRLFSAEESFDSVRETIASGLLGGLYRHPPTDSALFEDLLVSLVFKEHQWRITTALGPMRRSELATQIEGEPDLDAYPEKLLLVQRRFDISAEGNRDANRFDLEEAKTRLGSLVGTYLTSAPADVATYVATILRQKRA
jgi:hypothetical protein